MRIGACVTVGGKCALYLWAESTLSGLECTLVQCGAGALNLWAESALGLLDESGSMH